MKTKILTTTYSLHHGQKGIWKGDYENLIKEIFDLEYRLNQTMKYASTHTGISEIDDGYKLTALIELKNNLNK